jgi:hypothetical protein
MNRQTIQIAPDLDTWAVLNGARPPKQEKFALFGGVEAFELDAGWAPGAFSLAHPAPNPSAGPEWEERRAARLRELDDRKAVTA